MLKKLTKTFWIIIPVFVFFILFPSFSSQTNGANQGYVLGASIEAPGSYGPFLSEEQKNVTETKINKTADAVEPELGAKSALVFDLSTKQILYQKDPSKKLPIASLTKIMTSIVAMSDSNFSLPIIITKDDQVSVEPVLHLQEGDKVLPKDLIYSMLIGSANDAALTIANHFPDKEDFLKKMNTKAAELGMYSTNYSDPRGFDDDQNYSTATDLYRLVNYALDYLPYNSVWQTLNYSFTSQNGNNYYIRNSNPLVFKDSRIKSIKTGLSPMALGNMIVEAEDSKGDKIVSIVLDSPDREGDTLSLVNYIFKNYTWQQ